MVDSADIHFVRVVRSKRLLRILDNDRGSEVSKINQRNHVGVKMEVETRNFKVDKKYQVYLMMEETLGDHLEVSTD